MQNEFDRDQMETEGTGTDATNETTAQDDLDLDYSMDEFGERITGDTSDSDHEDDFAERLDSEPLAGEIEADPLVDDEDDTQRPVM